MGAYFGIAIVSFEQDKNFTITDQLRKHKISIDTFHMAPNSSPYWKPGRYLGMLIYSIGKFPDKQKFGYNISPGYVIMKDVKQLKDIKSGQGETHGRLCIWYFGHEPSCMLGKYKAVITGFEVYSEKQNMEIRKASQNFNSNSTIFHNSSKNMNDLEKKFIQGFLNLYRLTKQPHISAKDIHANFKSLIYPNGMKC